MPETFTDTAGDIHAQRANGEADRLRAAQSRLRRVIAGYPGVQPDDARELFDALDLWPVTA